ncbi:MAG: PASTA domain-containing protein [Myxococcales bacterium]|nr:PASTA domain-containing protein [Myxococcales bacterium]
MSLPASFRRRSVHVLGLGLSAAALAGLVHLQSVWAQEDQQTDADAEVWDETELEAEGTAEAEDALEEAAEALSATPDSSASAAAATPTPAPASVATEAMPVRLADASAVASVEAAVETSTEATAPVEVAVLVAVPDLAGMSLYKARKELKALGLKMSVRDAYNDRLPREYWTGYKVRSQKVEPGTEVEPGSRIGVKARLKRSYAMGY